MLEHHGCIAILLTEFFMGLQPWWRSKSLIALGLVFVALTIWWVAIKPFIWLFKKENKNDSNKSV